MFVEDGKGKEVFEGEEWNDEAIGTYIPKEKFEELKPGVKLIEVKSDDEGE